MLVRLASTGQPAVMATVGRSPWLASRSVHPDGTACDLTGQSWSTRPAALEKLARSGSCTGSRPASACRSEGCR